MRVRVKLNGVIVRLNKEGDLLATVSFSTADVAVLMRGATMRVAARLGSLSLVDNQLRNYGQPDFAKVLAIEGVNWLILHTRHSIPRTLMFTQVTIRPFGCGPDRFASRS